MPRGAGNEPRVPQKRISIGISPGARRARPRASPARGARLRPRCGTGQRSATLAKHGNTRVNLLISKISRTSGWSAATAIVPPCARACREASMRTRSPTLAM